MRSAALCSVLYFCFKDIGVKKNDGRQLTAFANSL